MVTRINEHIQGRPQDSEIIKHRSEITFRNNILKLLNKARPEDFIILYRTKFTKLAESLVLKTISKSTSNLSNKLDSSIPLLLFYFGGGKFVHFLFVFVFVFFNLLISFVLLARFDLFATSLPPPHQPLNDCHPSLKNHGPLCLLVLKILQ